MPTSHDSSLHPAVPYVVPFAVFMVLLSLSSYLTGLGTAEYPIRIAILSGVIYYFSRGVLDFRVRQFPLSLGIGLLVFAIWIGPDLLFPNYRTHWLFQNSITGTVKTSLPVALQGSALVLLFRSIRATIIVPIVEELFWRGWMMRWLVDRDFWKVELGTYTTGAMWITAALFASEHGPYWDVGLIAGLLYNWLMVRTKSLADCILAHAVTNGLICVYVLSTGKFQYWM